MNDTHIILPCNGTSTIVIIPVPIENENPVSEQNTNLDNSGSYQVPVTLKPNYTSDATMITYSEPITYKPNCSEEVTTIKYKCPETTTPQPTPCVEGTTTIKPKCPEMNTLKPKCPDTFTPKLKCPEVTTQKPECLEVTTIQKPKCPEVTTPKLKCPEVTTLKPECMESTITPKPKCPEVTTPKSECSDAINQKPPKQILPLGDPKPISGYGPNEVPPINLVAQPVLGSTVVYFYKHPSNLQSNPPSFYTSSTPTPYEEYTQKPKPPMLRLKQLLFPRLYAAFHPDE